MKGIILAGGNGTRLYPSSYVLSKQLLPVYDKPMIYYPLSTLMQAGIKEILIISTIQDMSRFKDLLGDGSKLGISLSYASQSTPSGIAEAFLIGEGFIGNDSVALILGDNLFYGNSLESKLSEASKNMTGASLFGYFVDDPERFGIVEFDSKGNVASIVEKPTCPKSNYAITGLYFYDNRVVEIAKKIRPSKRGELEITDINKEYASLGEIRVTLLDRGFVWMDTGTHEALLKASLFVESLDKNQNIKVACIEEVAYRKGYITLEQLKKLAMPFKKSEYGKYLLKTT